MEFMLGCNYWASNAGTEMWCNWDEQAIKADLKILSEYGVTHMRVFPNWRDFQPVMPLMDSRGGLVEYRLEGDKFPGNPYYLDEVMLDRFETFCDLCDTYNIKLIVGLLTGWMSGRIFIPSALYGKNLFTDATALLFEQRFIKGFVNRFKGRSCIYAWDLGNECNCMSPANNSTEAANWTSVISNAIKAADPTRPVVSGMHGLGLDRQQSNWTIQDQREFTDILTTHPYPYWCEFTAIDKYTSIRTLSHATAQTKLYGEVSNRPCLAEEIGTMGPMQCSDENAANFLRVNLFSNWANGACGVMWWCANEQTNLNTAPYTWNMCEVELGMLDVKQQPKPVLKEMKVFSEWMRKANINLPEANKDAVCILTQGQKQWGVGYMSYILAKQAGATIRYTYVDQPLPESKMYMLPSIKGHLVMPKECYDALREKVYNGADLYISQDSGILSGFEELTGVRVIESEIDCSANSTEFEGKEIAFARKRKFTVDAVNAEILAYDKEGNPAVTRSKYGKGTVWYVNFPLESMLLEEKNAFESNRYSLYSEIFSSIKKEHIIETDNKYVFKTEHKGAEDSYCVLINHSEKAQKIDMKINSDYAVSEICYGNMEEIQPFSACVIKLNRIKK